MAYKKPSYRQSKVVIVNTTRVEFNDYQTTQRKTQTCKLVSMLLLSVSSLNRRCAMFCRNPRRVSSSDSDILLMINSIRLRSDIVERLEKLASCVYSTIATVVVLTLKS